MSTSTVEKTATQVAVNDIGSHDDLLAAIEATMKDFNDGDIVEGRIVKVDRDRPSTGHLADEPHALLYADGLAGLAPP